MAHETRKELKSLVAELEYTAAARGPAGVLVQQHIAEFERAATCTGQRACSRELATAQQRSQAGQQLFDGERLGQIVVGARVQPGHAVADGVARSNHQDRHATARPNPARELEAIHALQDQVEEREVELHDVQRRQRLRAIGESFDPIAPVSA